MRDGYPDYGTGQLILTSDQLFPDDFPVSEELSDCHWMHVDDGYWISNFGHMYSSKTHSILSPQKIDRLGHLGYKPFINGKRKYLYLHRLIAQGFVPNSDGEPIVRHLNDNPIDNDLYNLAWGTQLDNMHDAARNGKVYSLTDEDREKSMVMLQKPTKAINLKSGEEVIFNSLADAARSVGVQQANAQKVVSGKRSHTCGWRFEYIRKED